MFNNLVWSSTPMNTNNGRAAKLIPARAALGSGNNTLAEKRGVGESI